MVFQSNFHLQKIHNQALQGDGLMRIQRNCLLGLFTAQKLLCGIGFGVLGVIGLYWFKYVNFQALTVIFKSNAHILGNFLGLPGRTTW